VRFFMSIANSRENIRALVESSLLVALGFILSYFTLFRMPQGGSITPLSMMPILMIGLRHGLKCGLGGGFVYACLQMIQQFYPPPTSTVSGFVAVIMLDYIAAFTVIGLSGIFKNRRYGLLYAAPLCFFLRFLCHFIAGIVVWGVYAEDLPIWLHSLVYNGSYMGVELVMALIVGAVLCKTAPILFNIRNKQSNPA